jgi:small conductance mechanosensitive channel
MNFDLLNSPAAAALWHDAATYSVDLIGAVVILVLGWWLAGWAGRTVRANLSRHAWSDATLAPLIANVVHYTILVGAILAVLDRFGIQLTSLVAVLGAAGLAIGLALQGTLSNVAAGVMLVILRPFRVGDDIHAAGFTGTVEEVGLFATTIRDGDKRIITVPNKMLSDAPIINGSRLPVEATVSVSAQIPYDADLDRAVDILRGVATANAGKTISTAPMVGVDELGDAAIRLKLQVTVPAAEADATKLRINLAIRQQFAAARIRFLQEANRVWSEAETG